MRAEARITGTILRDMVVCERRVWHDARTPARKRDHVGAFVQLLWAQGTRHEADVLSRLDGRVADLRGLTPDRRRRDTLRALVDPDVDHVLGAEIVHEDLLGRPDVVSRVDGRWVCGDVKSGSAFMPDGIRVREEYGVQIGLYARILHKTSLGDGERAFVLGPDGSRTMFDMDAPWGGSSMASKVHRLIGKARDVLDGAVVARGEASAKCGLCHWRTVCGGELEAADDLTMIAELGRSLRGVVEQVASTRTALAALDVDAVRRPDGKPGLPGLGPARLSRFRDRARLQTTQGATAYARAPLGLARAPLEWHFDIEADPTRDGCVYLHGIWERRLDGDGVEATRFVHFFADGPDGERQAFEGAWRFLNADPTAIVYYYSPFERTSYRALQRRYPEVCTAQEIEDFFSSARVVDLYTDVVRPRTEWPLSSFGLKPIAKANGFRWSAEDASGASSIAWYDEYVTGGDPAVRDRIVEYNMQDCEASAVVLDALIALPVGAPPWPPSPEPADGAIGGGSEAATDGEANPADVTGGTDDPAWRAEGEELARYFIERNPADRAPSSPVRPVAAPPCAPPPVAWSIPTLRPCTGIRSEDRGSAHDGRMAETYGSLATALPLLGAAAMRPEVDGGVALTRALRGEFPWLQAAVDAVERQLAIACWAGRPWLQLRPLCLVGGPGVGKSRFAHRLATLARVGTAALDLGAMHDAAALVAVSRGWSNAKPCWPAQMMDALGCANPVLVLDELEKAGGSRRNGEPQQALLAMTEPATARRYFDACLMVEVDLSAVCWVATANTVDGIPAPLASRFEIVRVGPPGPEHFDLVLDSLVAERERAWALPAGAMPTIPDGARATLRRAFVRRRSLRGLRRHLEMVLHALIVGAGRRLH